MVFAFSCSSTVTHDALFGKHPTFSMGVPTFCLGFCEKTLTRRTACAPAQLAVHAKQQQEIASGNVAAQAETADAADATGSD